MTKWSLGYQILRFFLGLYFKAFYKKIEVRGKDNIPTNKPIIFAANHLNALMDPLAIIFTNPNQSVFLARADIFNNPLLQKLFAFFKMLPIYRIRDGKNSLQNNERIFNKSVEILEANMSVALFPEATHNEKRILRILKKAVPRIAFLAEEKNNFELDVHVIPVGLDYENFDNTNKNLFVNYGQAIKIKDFEELYWENNQKGFLAFKEKLSESLQNLSIDIRDEENYQLYEDLRLIYRPEMMKKLNLKSKSPANSFDADKRTIAKIYDFFKENDISKLKTLSDKLINKCNSLNIDYKISNRVCLLKQVIKLLGYIVLLPVFLFGFINILPYYIIANFLIKKIKDPQFHSTLKFAAGFIIFAIFYTIHSIILYNITKDIVFSLLYFASALISTYVANKYRYAFKNFISESKILILKYFNKKEYKEYDNARKDLIQYLDEVTN